LHPTKRARPIARGELSPRLAELIAVVLVFSAVFLVAPLGLASIFCLCAFFALQAAYTLKLKHIVLLDVMGIAGLFVIRAAAGAAAVEVRISPWLLLCTALLALFLALAKRRGELVLVGAEATPGRPVLEGYSLALVDQLVTVVAASTVISYCLYTFTARPSKAMMITIPFVVFGVFRYLLLMHRHDLGEEPEEALLQALLEPAEERFHACDPSVDALPAGRDQVDQEREIVDTRIAVGQQIAVDPFELPDDAVHEPANLGEVARHGLRLVADRVADAARKRLFENECGGGERLHLFAGPGEERIERCALGALPDPFLCALDDAVVHVRQGYLGGRMKTRELEYDLPPALIAQHPVARRDESRLLLYERLSKRVHERRFAELPDVIGGALVVVNDTRVVPARIAIKAPKGEVLLLERLDEDGLWEGLARPTRRLKPGRRYGPVELLEHLGEGRWRLRLHGEPAGETPLPPYISEPLEDPGRYQTVYAREA